MRLGQLARKLSLRPTEIVEFLATNNIQIGDGSNTRIADEHAMLAIRHFAPGNENLLKEDESEQTRSTEPELPAISEVIAEEIIPEVVQTPIAEVIPSEGAGDETENIVEEEAAIIKAPKVELPGLKVIGKIDLPDPKKKEASQPAADESSVENNTDTELPKRIQREDRRPYQKRDRNDIRPRKNPIALQREREALESEKKKRAAAERAKEKRTNNYLKKVKPTQPTKAAKLITDEYVQMEYVAEKKPTSWFGRLIHWLKGKG